ncbi:MAPEG family protein [Ciceribacter sp. L1K23]|uniref:MAPEG family protein n=1 Tax=unclassified Ciceribacter TaxID=2628820 RepID=UPI001ABE6277|nr:MULTISPECIES: MAPEG family protein [unclassified Ciceribacter]MBO3758980.1 MAPEG family protein [Ciceribacter sp. L1K22]MBR0556873.1 MAPEG family protein [Ciceribacter sp. L1K23]
MTGFEIFWPILAQVLLVYALYGLLRIRRRSMVREGRMDDDGIRWSANDPPQSLVVKNCIANQFELPVLFYVCCILLYITEADNLPSVVAAWAFVASRYAHAAVHVTSNRVSVRFPLFMAGFILLGGLWGWLALWMATS